MSPPWFPILVTPSGCPCNHLSGDNRSTLPTSFRLSNLGYASRWPRRLKGVVAADPLGIESGFWTGSSPAALRGRRYGGSRMAGCEQIDLRPAYMPPVCAGRIRGSRRARCRLLARCSLDRLWAGPAVGCLFERGAERSLEAVGKTDLGPVAGGARLPSGAC